LIDKAIGRIILKMVMGNTLRLTETNIRGILNLIKNMARVNIYGLIKIAIKVIYLNKLKTK
jgi:hypothetical protein